jgi:predicted ester cyclase
VTAEESKAFIHRFYAEVWHHAGTPPLDAFIADHLSVYKQSITVMRATFRNLTWTLETLIADGDEVAERWRMQGTHKLTNTRVAGTGASFFRLADGKIVEHGAYSDPDLQHQMDSLPQE